MMSQSQSQPRLLVAGGLRVDYIITAEDEVRVREIGGNGIYSAVGARIWEPVVALLGKVGNNYPMEWLTLLSHRGIVTDTVVVVPGQFEQRTFYAYKADGTRIDSEPRKHFERVGHPMPDDLLDYEDSLTAQREASERPVMLLGGDIPDKAGSRFSAAHIAPMGTLTQFELVRGLREAGVSLITVDPGEGRPTPETLEMLQATCRMADVYMPSQQEVKILLGDVDAYHAARTFAEWGAPLVVVKRGARGALVYESATDRFTEIPTYPTHVTDVTGAGDTFCGAFAAAMMQSGDPIRAALMGTVAASFAIEAYGALHPLRQSPTVAERRLAELTQQL